MKLGVITDIHNNVLALKCVLEQLMRMNCDQIICCGDIIGIGPYPEETVNEMMRISNLIAVRGNHEKYLLEYMPTEYPNEAHMDYEEMAHHKWGHGCLSAASVAFLGKLPNRVDISSDGVRVSVMHSCMDHAGQYTHSVEHPTEQDLEKMFADVDSDVILYGHSHSRCICRGSKYYLNFGSLGCPGREQNIARAGIVVLENGKVTAEPIDLEYDADEVVRAINRIHYPAAEEIKKHFYGV